MISVAEQNDVELVGESLSGNRDAFGQIVARYQSLVCSLAFSATGSLSQSEDLAQETFVTAWKKLSELREPEKLRAWLCGIARNLINNFLRKQGREPSHRAKSLEEISESHSPEPLPAEQAIVKWKKSN
jgi:RNA polymerase sigma factor (sigma-70 family)